MKITCPVLILAGGFGTRLRKVVSNVPKPMAPIKGRPFLEWLIEDLQSMGTKRIILSTGYMAEVIENHPWSRIFPGLQIDFLREVTPLGPGGAVAFAFETYKDLNEVWVVNGDTLLVTKWPDTLNISEEEVGHYITQQNPPNPHNVPNLNVQNHKIISVKDRPTHFDTGFVWVSRNLLGNPRLSPPYSIHQLLEESVKMLKVGHTEIRGEIFDIGTPEKLDAFDRFLSRRES